MGPHSSRLVRLLWCDAPGLVPRGDPSAVSMPGVYLSRVVDVWKLGGFMDTTCPSSSLAGKER